MKTIINLLSFACVMLLSCDKELNDEGLRAYIRTQENGLSKTVRLETMKREVTYFPCKLLFNREDVGYSNDSIDYFLVKSLGHNKPILSVNSFLIIKEDTLNPLDALVLPNLNSTAREKVELVAFKSYLSFRREEEFNLVVDSKKIRFSVRDVKAVNKIKVN